MMKRADAVVVAVVESIAVVVRIVVGWQLTLDLELCAWFVWSHRVTYPRPYQSPTRANAFPHRSDFRHR